MSSCALQRRRQTPTAAIYEEASSARLPLRPAPAVRNASPPPSGSQRQEQIRRRFERARTHHHQQQQQKQLSRQLGLDDNGDLDETAEFLQELLTGPITPRVFGGFTDSQPPAPALTVAAAEATGRSLATLLPEPARRYPHQLVARQQTLRHDRYLRGQAPGCDAAAMTTTVVNPLVPGEASAAASNADAAHIVRPGVNSGQPPSGSHQAFALSSATAKTAELLATRLAATRFSGGRSSIEAGRRAASAHVQRRAAAAATVSLSPSEALLVVKKFRNFKVADCRPPIVYWPTLPLAWRLKLHTSCNTHDVTLLLREIMTDARELTRAERCSLFLLDREQNELVAKVFDGHSATPDEQTPPVCTELRIPVNEGIAGHVATTGEILNIRDAYNHPLFYRRLDEMTGFRTKNVLCFPIKDDQQVIGVAELCNKVNGKCFSFFDEEMAKAFSIYCGIAIMHSLMWKKVRDAQQRSRLSNELMMYHILVPDEEVHHLVTAIGTGSIPTPRQKFHPDFETFQGLPRAIPDRDTPLAVVTMFEDLGFVQRWRISRTTLARFVLMVRKGYRDPPYHNWTHAFSVTHYSYLLIKHLNLVSEGYLTENEALSLFVACLCHDLDHRGTTNTFQVNSKTVLASLYSSEGSVMERHHFAQAMAIVNTDGCNIFENLECHEYTKILDNMREIILATDLSHHFKIMPKLQDMATCFKKDDPQHHQLLMCLLVTSCDLSDQTKDFKATKQVAELIYKEFFSQGDLEKSMGINPDKMMDREKAFIPELQIQFIDGIVRPAFQLLAQLFSSAAGAQQSLQAVKNNVAFWQRFREIYLAKHGTHRGCSLTIFQDQDLEEEVVSSLQSTHSNRKRNFDEHGSAQQDPVSTSGS